VAPDRSRIVDFLAVHHIVAAAAVAEARHPSRLALRRLVVVGRTCCLLPGGLLLGDPCLALAVFTIEALQRLTLRLGWESGW
jgi:hypothetical protein